MIKREYTSANKDDELDRSYIKNKYDSYGIDVVLKLQALIEGIDNDQERTELVLQRLKTNDEKELEAILRALDFAMVHGEHVRYSISVLDKVAEITQTDYDRYVKENAASLLLQQHYSHAVEIADGIIGTYRYEEGEGLRGADLKHVKRVVARKPAEVVSVEADLLEAGLNEALEICHRYLEHMANPAFVRTQGYENFSEDEKRKAAIEKGVDVGYQYYLLKMNEFNLVIANKVDVVSRENFTALLISALEKRKK